MTQLALEVEWSKPGPNDSAFGPERATWGRLRVAVAGEDVTSNHPADVHGPDRPFVVGPMAGLADWIVDAWLPLQWETHTPFAKVVGPRSTRAVARLPSLRDAATGWPEFVRDQDSVSGSDLGSWQQRHTLGVGSSDLALPSIVLLPEDEWVGVGLDHLPAALCPTVRFTAPGSPDAWPSPPVWIPKADAIEGLRTFVDSTIARASKDAKARTWAQWLGSRWAIAQEQAKDPTAIRAWQHGPIVAREWGALAQELGERLPALVGVLIDSAPIQDAASLRRLASQVAGGTRTGARAGVDAGTPDWGLPPFVQGYRLAQRTRAALGSTDAPIGDMATALARLGVSVHAVPAGGLFRTACWTIDETASVVWAQDDPRFDDEAPKRFAMAAALARLLLLRGSNGAAGAAHGDQSRWRPSQLANAFAAEFLLPVQALRRSADLAVLCRDYGISKSAAAWHSSNRLSGEA